MTGAKEPWGELSEPWVRAFAKAHRLSPRETQLLQLLMAGRVETAELALLMDIQPGSVKKLFEQIYAKTRTTSRAALVLAVLRHHYGTPPEPQQNS